MSNGIAWRLQGSRWAGRLAAWLVVLWHIPALATWPRMDQGVYIPGMAVALPQESLSLMSNPAGLAAQQDAQLRLQLAVGGSSEMASRGGGYGLLLGMPFGPFGIAASIEHVRDPAPGASFGPGFAQFSRISGGGGVTFDRWFHVGGAIRLLTAQAEQLGTIATMDVGLMLTPWKWFTLGARVTDLVGATSFLLPDTIGGITGPQYTWGWAFRWEDKFKWSFDLGWPSIAPITVVASTIAVRLDDEYSVAAEYRQTLHNASVTGHATGSDARVALVLRWRSKWFGAEAGVLRDLPEGDPRANGAVLGAQVHKPFKVPLWHRAMAALGMGEAGRVAQRTSTPRARAPDGELTHQEIVDHARRSRLGWQPPLKGAYRREGKAVAAVVMAFSKAMADEDKQQLCKHLAPGRLRFDVATMDPPLNIHRNLERDAACVSMQSGELAKYVKEFGPSHPHADMATVIPSLFAIHGSPFLHLPQVQLQAYGKAVLGQRGRAEKLACSTYRASRLPADRETPAKQRRYEVTIGCERVANYHLEVIGNRTLGFKVRKVSIRRLAAPR